MQKHQSLPRSLRQLRSHASCSATSFKVLIVSHEGRDVAAGVYHVWGERIELIYNGSAEHGLELRPNHALYWNVMRWAAARGLRSIDLGGAYAGTPLAGFKQQWGAAPRPRFRLTQRTGGEATRAESIAAFGYGAEHSESRLMDLAWGHVPLDPPAPRRTRRLPVPMSITRMDPGDRRRDAYVRAHPRATIYQLAAWARILGEATGSSRATSRSRARTGDLQGVLPLLYKKGLVSDARVRSLPVFPAGGPLADTHEQEIALIQAARDSRSAMRACSP